MKSLTEALATLQHIIEAEKKKIDPSKARDEVKSLANNDDTADDIIRNMWSAASSELKVAWQDMCERKNYTPSQSKQLLGVLIDHDLMELAAACCNDDGLVTSDKLLDHDKPFKFGSFLDRELLDEYKLTPEAIEDIVACQPPNNGTSVGPGEMFLTCVIKDAVQNGGSASSKAKNADTDDNSEITGDIKIGNLGLEVKGSNASFFGQKGIPLHNIMVANVNNMVDEIGGGVKTPIGCQKKSWGNFYNAALSYYHTTAKVAEKMFDGVYTDSRQSKNFENFIKELGSKKESFQSFHMWSAAYALKQYNAVDSFDSIIFIQTKGHPKDPTAMVISHIKGKSITQIYEIFSQYFDDGDCFDYNNQRRVMSKVDLKSL